MQGGNEFPFILPFFLSCSTIEFFQVQSTKSSKYFSHAHSTQTLEEHETTWRLVLRHVSHVFQKVKCPLLGHWWVLHKSSLPHSSVLVLRGEKLFLSAQVSLAIWKCLKILTAYKLMRIFEIFFSLVVIPGTFLLHLLDYRSNPHYRSA